MKYENQVIHGDCVKVMEKFEDNCINAIITDVPYNLGETDSQVITFEEREDMNRATEAEWNKGFNPTRFLPEAKRVLKENGNIFIYTHHRHFGDYYDWLDEHFERVFFGVWHKTNPPPQVRKVSFLSACELFIVAYDKGHKWNFLGQKKMHNFIESPICMGKERTEHTAQKPIKAIKKLIRVSTDERDIVLDPFLGSGTTAVACKQLNRKFVGIEIEKKWVEKSRERLKKQEEPISNFL